MISKWVESLRRRVWSNSDIFYSVALIVVALVVYGQTMAAPILGQDEGILLVYPGMINQGALPYRDFSALYPPGNFHLIALAFFWFGETIGVERAVGVFYKLALVLLFYALGRRYSQGFGLFLGLVVVVLTGRMAPLAHGVEAAIALFLLALNLIWAAALQVSSSRGNAFSLAAGLLVGLTFWLRQDVAVYAVLSLGLASLLNGRQRLLLFLAGVFCTAAPLLMYLGWIGLDDSIRCLVRDVVSNSPGRALPQVWSGNLAALWIQILAWLGILLALIGLPLEKGDKTALLVAAVFSLLFSISVFQRLDSMHFQYGAIAISGLLVWALGLVAARLLPSHLARALPWLLGAAPLMLLGFYRHQAALLEPTAWVSSPQDARRTVPVAAERAPGLRELLAYVNDHRQAGQRLIVAQRDLRFSTINDSYLYHLLPALRPGTRYIELNPFVANAESSGFAAELLAADVLIQTSAYDLWQEPNGSRIPGSPAAAQVAAQHFCPQLTASVWSVQLRCVGPHLAQ